MDAHGVLVTGGAGFIGSHLVAALQGERDLRVLDNFATGHRENLEGMTCTVLEGSVTDRERVREALRGVDIVFHLAAQVSVPASLENPHPACMETNTLGTLVMLEEAARAGAKKLVFASSAAVYGDGPEEIKTEDLPPRPLSPYAISKMDGEWYADLFRREGWLNTVSLRFFNVFGPRQDAGSAYAAVVAAFTDHARRGVPLKIFGDGRQTRDFVYVEDVAAANLHLARHPEARGAYNVARGGRMSILDLAHAVLAQTGSASPIEHAPARPGDPRHSQASVERLRATGFSPSWSMAEGLQRALAADRAR